MDQKNNFFQTKKRLIRFLLAVFILILGIVSSIWFFQRTQPKSIPHTHSSEIKSSLFFVTLPIAAYSAGQLPCLEISIEDQQFLALLDTAYRGDVAASEHIIQKMSDKFFIYTRSMYGIRGKEYPEKVYDIPKTKIGPVVFHNLRLQEENPEMRADALFNSEGENTSRLDSGKVGWLLFSQSNLFLDLNHSKIAFADSIETVKKNGYELKSFTKVPLLTDRGLVEFEILTNNGPARCSLDTGASWNMINIANKEEKSYQELITDINKVEFTSFQIGGKEFGPISFHRFPVKLPIPIEFTFGMEFFRSHLVFIDFWNNLIYFSPS